MCGIAGVHVLEPGSIEPARLELLAAELLRSIDHRGGDATGYATFGAGRVQVQKASCRAGAFLTEWSGVPDGTETVLLHTRYATQGKAAFPENNHPVQCGSVYVVHNGHIGNDAQLFGTLPFQRVGRVDSEVIPAVLLDAGWTEPGAGLERLDGSFAIAAVSAKHPGELLLARSGWSPLVYATNGRILVWASEASCIAESWRRTFGGSAPARMQWLLGGDLVRVKDGAVQESRFEGKADRYVGWEWSAAKPSGSGVSLACNVAPVRPERAGLVDVIGSQHVTRPGSVQVWDGSAGRWEVWRPGETLDDVAVEVRCGCCDEWLDPNLMDDVLGELVCDACATFLLDV